MLLVETYNPKTKQKEYEIPLSEDLYNIVLFSKSGKYNNKPKENSVNKERCKTLFLLDFNIDRNATNKESVYNLLENICNYAY